MMKLFRFYLTVLIFSALFLFINFSVFADVQIYPPAGSTIPYGNAQGTEPIQMPEWERGGTGINGDGATNNHLVGQSFKVPSDVGMITKVRLTNFGFGSGGATGLISVGLFAGAPYQISERGRSLEGQDSPINYWITTGNDVLKTIPSGAKIAGVDNIFVPGDMNNFVNMCGIPNNNVVRLLMKRVKFNTPDKPCPKYSEWLRMFNYWGNRGWGPLTAEWGDGSEDVGGWEAWRSDGQKDIIVGDSELLWGSGNGNGQPEPPSDLTGNSGGAGGWYKDSATSLFEGPNWVSGGGTVEVTLPPNIVIPNGQYFLALQQSHTDPDRGSAEDHYFEQYRENCEQPNKTSAPGNVLLYGTLNSGGSDFTIWPSWHFCEKGNLFYTTLSTNNVYPDGRAYHQHWSNGSEDVANLIISGASVAVPAATVGGSTTGTTKVALTYTGNASSGGLDSNLSSGALYVRNTDNSTPAANWGCPGNKIVGTIWCEIDNRSLTGQSDNSLSGNITFTKDSNYYVAVNVYNENGKKCTGNPLSKGSFDAFCDNGSPRADYMTVVIKTPPTGAVSGPTTGKVGDTLAYVGSVTDGGGGTGLSKAQLYVGKADGSDSTLWCTGTVEGVNKEWCKLGGDESMAGASGTISRTWIPKIDTPNGSYHIVVNAYNYNIDPNDALKCSGDPWGVTPPWVDCGANDYVTVNIQTTDCTVTDFLPISGCYSSFPTLSASMGNGANQLQFAVDTDNGFASPWTCNSGWSSSTTYNSCSISTGDYYWGASSKDEPTGSCTTPVAPLPIPGNSFSIDQTGPSTPAVSTASYNPITDISGNITFNWSPSTDVGCAACDGKATKYWVQGWWSGGGWFVNDGVWAPPGTCANTSYGPVTCDESHYGQTAYFKAVSAKDTNSNESAQQTTTSSYTCPAPPPTLGELQVVANTSTGATPKSVSANGLREDDSTAIGVGHNINNALQITQNALSTIEPPNNIALVGTAFTGTIAAPSTLQDLKNGITSGNNGFILMYANKDVTLTSGPIASLCPSGQTNNFCANVYYIYMNGAWRRIPMAPAKINISLNGETGAEIQVTSSTIVPKAPAFSVTFYKLLGSQKWSTYGYLMDAYNQTNGQNDEIIQSKAPVVLTP